MRLTDNLISWPASGAMISNTIPTTNRISASEPAVSPPLESRRPRPPPQNHERMKTSDINTAAPTTVATTVPIKMSRSRMWDISWPITPSSSTRFIVSSRPWVTAIDECLGSRPVAKALGAASGTT